MRCRLSAAGLLIAAAVCLPAVAAIPPGNPEQPPSIILILADDLGIGDCGCYGQSLIRTPWIDRLAAEGMRFRQAYAGSPVCAPSRAVLMTGRHNGHSSVRDNVPHFPTYLQKNDITIAAVLQEAGYRTGGTGKWSLGDAGTAGRATQQGFETWFGYLNQDHAHYYFPEYLDDNEARLLLPGNSRHRTRYSHDLIVSRALDFIRRADRDRRPFFLYVAFTLPHISAPAEDPDRLPVPSTAPYSTRPWPEAARKYAAMVHRLDDAVGRLVDLVDRMHLTERTLILFTSDNGAEARVASFFHSTGPYRGAKRQLTEGGIRVPLIARWPGTIPAGTVSEDVVAFQDVFPTLCELADVPVPQDTDGMSLTGILRGRSPGRERGYLYWDYGHCRQRYDRAVRWRQWKGLQEGRDAPVQLYNLETDPGETRDVAAEHPGIVRRILRIMDRAAVPHPRYPIGQVYTGRPIWSPPWLKEDPAAGSTSGADGTGS